MFKRIFGHTVWFCLFVFFLFVPNILSIIVAHKKLQCNLYLIYWFKNENILHSYLHFLYTTFQYQVTKRVNGMLINL